MTGTRPDRRWLVLATAALLAAAPAAAQLTIPGANDSDGAFNPTCGPTPCTFTVDLDQAAGDCSGMPCQWDDMSPLSGNGVYDRDKWAVVFHYSSVDVPAGVTVEFDNHDSRAPVVWLVSGSVAVSGTVALKGRPGDATGLISEPGPGGYRGGRGATTSSPPSGGFGPETGDEDGFYGSGNPTFPLGKYGNQKIVPLLGGAGGDGDPYPSLGGGAGGGAILIAASVAIVIDGSIDSSGGPGLQALACVFGPAQSGSGSGGAVRLLADSVSGGGSVLASGGVNCLTAGPGRIRIEANSNTLAPGQTDPGASTDVPDDPPQLWPDAMAPVIRVTQVDGVAVGTDPRARFEFSRRDVRVANPDEMTVTIETENVPMGWTVYLLAVPVSGPEIVAGAGFQGTDGMGVSTWTANLTLGDGFASLQARACDPAAGSSYCPTP